MRLLPSLFSAPQLSLGSLVAQLDAAGCTMYHYDMMDFDFVPNIGLSFGLLQELTKKTNGQIDVHLMVQYPERYVDRLAGLGVARVTVHMESASSFLLPDLATYIHSKGIQPGLTAKPGTPITSFAKELSSFDHFLIMSVEPGYGGQLFLPDTYERIEQLKKYIPDSFLLQIDGGVTLDHIPRLQEMGVSEYIVGSSLFKGDVAQNFTSFSSALGK